MAQSLADPGTTVETVRLDMDYRGYETGAQRASAATAGLINQVDILAQKMDRMRNQAGNKLIVGGLGISAGLGVAIATAAKYEQQISSLVATSNLAGRSTAKLNGEITQLTKSLPVTRSELISVAETLNDMGISGEKNIAKVAGQMARLSSVTGDSIPSLTKGVVDLSRAMGSTQDIERWTAAVAKATSAAGASPTQTLQFAQAIAPFTRQAGMNTQDTIGFATAFTKAGADGFAAANTFSSVLNDIVRLTESGSPQLAKYANLLGVTQEEFAKMSKTEQLVGFFEAINEQGPKAAKTLERLGYDGMRTAKAITSVANQSGGIRKALADAGYGASGAGMDEFMSESDKAMSGVSDTLTKLQNDLESTKKAIGDSLLTPMQKVLDTIMAILAPVNDLIRALAPILGPVAATSALALLAGGAVLKGFKILTAITAAMYVGRSSPIEGFRAGMGSARAGMAGTPAGIVANPFAGRTNMMGRVGSAAYMMGMGLGGRIGLGDGSPSLVRQAMGVPFRIGNWWYGGAEQMARDAALPGSQRPPMFGPSTPGPGPMGRFVPVPAGTPMMTGPNGMKIPQLGPVSQLPTMDKSVRATMAAANTALNLNARNADSASKAFVRTLGRYTVNTAVVGGQGIAKGLGMAGGMLGMSGPMMGILAGGALSYAAISKYRSQRKEEEAIDPGLILPMNAYREELGRTTMEVASFKDAVKAAKDELKKPEGLPGPGEGLRQADIRYALRTQDQPVQAGVENLQSPEQAAAFVLGTGGDPELRREAMLDIYRTMGVAGGKRTEELILGAQLPQGLGREENIQRLMATGAEEGNFGANRLPWFGNPDEQTGRMDLAVGLQQERFIETMDKEGVDAASQEMWNSVLTSLTETAKNGDSTDMQNLVSKYVEAGILDEGVNAGLLKAFEDGYRQYGVNEQGMAAAIAGQTPDLTRGLEDQGIMVFGTPEAREGRQRDLQTEWEVENKKTWDNYGPLGKYAMSQDVVKKAVDKDADPSAKVTGMQKLQSQAMSLSTSLQGADQELRKLQMAINDPTDALYQLAGAARQSIAGLRTLETGGKSRAGQVESKVNEYKTVSNMPEDQRGVGWDEEVQATREGAVEALAGYQEYLKGLVKTFRAYETNMDRAEKDYNRSRRQANEDFTKSQRYAAEDYQRQQQYSTEDFYKQQLRALEAFNLAQERMIEDSAKTLYDPYTRAMAQFTYGADSLLMNLQRQNELMAEQMNSINALRDLGLSDDVINQLDLFNPENRAQAEKLAKQLAENPALVTQFNTAIRGRLDMAEGLTTDPSNDAFQRMQEDFDIAARQAEEDFKTAMGRAQTAYEVQLTRATESFNTQMVRMQEQYTIQMNRAQEDLTEMMYEVTGDFADIAAEAVRLIGVNLPGMTSVAIAEINKTKDAYIAAVNEMNEAIPDQYPSADQRGPTPTEIARGPNTIPIPGHPAWPGHDGGIVRGTQNWIIGETGHDEAVIPLTNTGTTFMTTMVREVVANLMRSGNVAGLGSPVSSTAGAASITYSDQSTSISVGVVETASAEDFMKQMEDQKRRRALVRPKASSR